MRQIVGILVRSRFGEVPPRLLRRIEDADTATLEHLTARAGTVRTLDELLDS